MNNTKLNKRVKAKLNEVETVEYREETLDTENIKNITSLRKETILLRARS